MKTKKLLFIVMILVLAFTAGCGGKDATPAPVEEPPAEAPVEAPVVEEQPAEVPVEEPAEVPVEEPAEAPAEEPAAPLGVGMDFVVPEDASNMMEIGDGTLSFQTALSIPDVMTFYRFSLMGFNYTEREALTTLDDMTFNIVFDGHESGKAIIIQGFKTETGVSVGIRLGDA